MTAAGSCLSFAISCGTMFKGIGVVAAGLILFIGSVYVLLAAIFGRWMGYLVLMVAFTGWLIIQSSVWMFGFWSQGPDTKTNLGPRGSEPAWQVLAAGITPTYDKYGEFAQYPGDGWETPAATDVSRAADLLSVQGAATTFLAAQANQQLGIDPLGLDALQTTNFTIDSVSFADAPDGTQLSVATAHFTGGGPETTLLMYHNSGSVPRYSLMFLVGAIVLFLIHVPLLDRAEKSRKAFLTGGTSPPWYGPA